MSGSLAIPEHVDLHADSMAQTFHDTQSVADGRYLLDEQSVADGRYLLDEMIHYNSHSVVVYAATDTVEGSNVAIKAFHEPSESARRRVDHEIMANIALRGVEGVAQVLDMGIIEEGEAPARYMTTRLEEGSLSDLLKEGPLDTANLLEFLPKIIRTIGHIRKLGLAHMDIKPNNILGNKEGTRVLIADLGGVKALREEADSPSDLTGVEFSEENSDALSYVKDFTENFGLIYGSSGYMAPETINGQSPVPETDMFSWAMLAIQATTGELPVDASTFELYKRAIVDESPVPVEIIKGVVPADLYQVVKACSNKDPGMRFGPDHALQLLENA